MAKVFVWVVIIVCLYIAYQAGLFNSVISYFSDYRDKAREEQVIENADGSYTTVKYKNVFDLFSGK